MSKPTALRSVSSFADLPELYAELTTTPDFVASFGDPLPLTIIDGQEEPDEFLMPDPLAAQAECGGIIAAIFDLLGDTRLDSLAPEQIGRAHVRTPVTTAHLVCRLLLEK